MPEKYELKYYYKSEIVSRAGAAHVFKYLSAFSDYRFLEDDEAPVIYRNVEGRVPASARVILGDGKELKEPSASPGKLGRDWIHITPDPIEGIFKKIAAKTSLGPYSEIQHVPANSLEESLGAAVRSFFIQLMDAGIIQLKRENVSLWPDDHSFAVALSHDVDMVRRSVRGSVKLLFRRDVPGGMRGLLDSIVSFLGLAENPYDKVRAWINREKEKGLKSTFFIFAGDRLNKNDPKYSPDRLVGSIEWIIKNDQELGLHTGIDCFKGIGIGESKMRLGRFGGDSITGIRPHYLSASLPEYWHAAAENGFEYSSCLGFDDDIGFFQGLDLPFVPFDAESDAAIGIVEVPLGIMDCGLIGKCGNERGILTETGRKLVDRVKAAGGILVLDWHQRTMYNADYPGWAEAFFGLVDYARSEGAYFTTMGKAAQLLKSRMEGRN